MLLSPFVSVVEHLRRQMLGLLIFSVAFTAALSQVEHSQKDQAIVFGFLTAFPIGFLETGTTLVVQLDAPDEDIGMAYGKFASNNFPLSTLDIAPETSSFLSFGWNFRLIHDTHSCSIWTWVYFWRRLHRDIRGHPRLEVKAKIASYVTGAVLEAGLAWSSLPQLFHAMQSQSPAAFAKPPGMAKQIQAAVALALENAYADAFAYVYYAALAVGGVAVVAALCIKDYDSYMTGHVPKQVHRRGHVGTDAEDNITEKAMGGEDRVDAHKTAFHDEGRTVS
ncbi:hypothetical protein RBB50_007171 [Rhinocladiella similis]